MTTTQPLKAKRASSRIRRVSTSRSLLFGARATEEYLAERVADGAVVKATTLSEEFDYEDFVAMYGEDALRLFIINESGSLSVVTADATPSVKAGQTLISLVDPTAADGERPEAIAAVNSEGGP